MPKIIKCDCGEVVQGSDDDELVANVQAHVDERHPELARDLSRDDVLARAEEA